MAGWVWVLIVVGAVIVIGAVIWGAASSRRSRGLRERFGPEYERTVDTAESKSSAEKELREREERRDQLQLRPLSAAARERHLQAWQTAQAQFVDSPAAAVATVDSLIQSVMAERGYSVADFDRRAADISVDHPTLVQNYREGHRLSELSAAGQGTTEDLRQAMQHYRALFEELVDERVEEPGAPQPSSSPVTPLAAAGDQAQQAQRSEVAAPPADAGRAI